MTGLILRLLAITLLNIFAFGMGITQQYGLLATFVISLVLFVVSYCGESIIEVIGEILEGVDFSD